MRQLGIAFILIVLGGCAVTRPGVELPEMASWDERQAVLSQFPEWEFRGRVAVKAGDEGFNGKISWTQTGEQFYATVGGPLGIGTVVIEGTDDQILITDEDGVKTPLVDPERELYLRYGWTIPVASLRFWALGIPGNAPISEISLNDEGRLASLTEGSWNVVITRYKESAGQQMPRTLTATNPDTRVRMIIDKWIFFER